MDSSEKIVATTKVSIPQGDGPIEATSTIEAVPNSLQSNNNQFDRIDIIESTYETTNYRENAIEANIPMEPIYKRSTKQCDVQQQQQQMPTAPPAPTPEPETNPKLLLNLQGRQHEFINRTILRTESCFHCAKK